VSQLTADPETEKYAPNKESRQVKSGHYVLVRPDPLPEPSLVIHSPVMAESLGISPEEVHSDRFTKFFSGDIDQLEGSVSWATPYALSIMGNPQYQNCPFGNGNGYGDGRAISVGEVVVQGKRWEMQMKGGGRTPFCRGGDGRAVLRSSIREFLASEAMHHLGVDTTRALSLVVSAKETSQRPWYQEMKLDDARFSALGPEEKKQVMTMLAQPRNPDMMITEPCAITTRVAPSFLRVGHVDLFSRRASKTGATDKSKKQLEQMVEHLLFREYPDLVSEDAPIEEKARALLPAVAQRLSTMVAGWLRVGFCQGNFNADNCLVGGRTMDYGPFGWMDKYDPFFAKWVGSGQHFAFMNQPNAALANYQTFAMALLPLMGKDAEEQIDKAVMAAVDTFQEAVLDTWRSKMGLSSSHAGAEELWEVLEPLLRKSSIDFTLFWRQLAHVARTGASTSDEDILAPLDIAFYVPPDDSLRVEWRAWLRRWLAALQTDGDAAEASARMNTVNPKYVAREWMLVEAYDLAGKGDYSMVQELYELFKNPYNEQPELESKYYKRAPEAALMRGGTAYMS